MKVSFHATIREMAGVPEADVGATSVRELLQKLQEMFGARFFDLIVKDGKLREDVVILVNGGNVSHSGGLDALLSPEDDVAIFPPVSGG